jgi:dTMP kinase
LVTLEGPDGAGKSTQARLLAAALKRRGRKVTLTREPGGSPRSLKIRNLLLDPALKGLEPAAELFLFAADRRQHVADTLEPALRRGEVVVCDRFTDSTLAYQGTGRALDPGLVARVTESAAAGLAPDLTLLLDLPPKEGLERARRRSGKADRMENSAEAYFRRVRKGFLDIARREPERVRLIKVAGRTPEDIAAEAFGYVEALLVRR